MKSGKSGYRVEMTNAAYKVFKKFDPPLKEKVKEETLILKETPYKYDNLSGLPYKIRSYHFNFKGIAYRIAYDINEKKKTIYIKLIGNRENFYEKLKMSLKI